jgi:hypothetical protein
MYAYIKDIKYKNHEFRVEIVKSNIEEINNWDICVASAISGKALLRIAEKNSINVFNNPYGLGNHLYDFDVTEDINTFIRNNKNKKDCNDYFIIIYTDIEIDETTNKIAETSDNFKAIDRIINTILENITL